MRDVSTQATWEDVAVTFSPESDDEYFKVFEEDCKKFVEALEKVSSKYRTLAKKKYLSELSDKWNAILGLSESDILSHIAATTNYSDEYVPDYLSASELLYGNKSFSKLGWIIPEFLPSSGLYLLAAMPKAGKTVLTDFIKYAMLVSGEFLGRPVKSGSILDIQTEMSSPEIISNLESIGFKDLDDANVAASIKYSDKHRIKLSFNLATDLPWLDREITKYKPSLVIFDSLRSMARTSGLSENTQEFGNLVYALQSVINKHAVCGLLIHHMKKPPEIKLKKGELPSLDIIAQASGHTSITAGTSGVIGLLKLPNGHRYLKAELRVPTDARVTYTLRKDLETGISKLVVIEDSSQLVEFYSRRILRFLYTNLNCKLSASEIVRNVASENEFAEAQECLSYLRDINILRYKSGKVGKKREMYYWLEDTDKWLLGEASDEVSVIAKELILASKLSQCATKSEIRALFAELDKSDIKKACDNLLEHEYKRFETILKLPEYSIESTVKFKIDDIEHEGTIKSVTLSESPSLNNTLYSIQLSDGTTVEVKEADILHEVINIVKVEYPEKESCNVEIKPNLEDLDLT